MMYAKDLPSHADMVDNLVSMFGRTTMADRAAGISWYPLYRMSVSELADRYGVSVEIASAVVAALSPQTDPARNLDIADDILDWHTSGFDVLDAPTSTRDRRRRCSRALAGDLTDIDRTYRTPKVYSFNRAILGDLDAVTVDRHAARAALGDPLLPASVGPEGDPAYRAYAAAYREAAHIVGMSARDLQATLWTYVKRARDELSADRSPSLAEQGVPL